MFQYNFETFRLIKTADKTAFIRFLKYRKKHEIVK